MEYSTNGPCDITRSGADESYLPGRPNRNIFFFEVRHTAANFILSEPHASLMQLPTVERCPSGLRSTLGKRVLGKLNRGFESHPLRHTFESP